MGLQPANTRQGHLVRDRGRGRGRDRIGDRDRDRDRVMFRASN